MPPPDIAHAPPGCGPAPRVRGPASSRRASGDRVGVAVGYAREMSLRCRCILEEAKRDPAGGELMLGAIILPLRDYGVAGDAVGLCGVAAVEHVAGGQPPLDPPLVGIDDPRIARHRQDHVGGLDVAVGAAQPLRQAELVADVAAGRRRHRIERRLGVLGLLDDGDARLGDGRHVAAGAVGIAQPALGVLGIEAHVHARLVVGCGDQAAKRAHHLGFEVGAEGIVVPGLAHLCLRAGAVALSQAMPAHTRIGPWR